MSLRSAEVVAEARRWLGTPYRHQASLCGAGCDCLGLLRGVWRAVVGPEPEALPPYRASLRDIVSASALEMTADRLLDRTIQSPGAGRVVLFRMRTDLPAKHCGILTGEDRFIHAQEGLGVIEAPIGGWEARISRYFDFPVRAD